MTGRRTDEPAPQSADEALARAIRHTRRAAAEAAAALRALLDAASLATTGTPSEGTQLLSAAAGLLDEVRAWLEADREAGEGLVTDLAEALDEEIHRWEERARSDDEARAVLRAFLGLRELLWELGVRPRAAAPEARPRAARKQASESRDRRIRRVRVEG